MLKLELKNSKSIISEINSKIDNLLSPQIDRKMNELVDALKAITPKKTGYAASRWQISDDQNIFRKVSTTITFKDKSYILSNDAKYITELNDGLSTQAPAKFIEQTILNEGFKPTGSIVTQKS